MSSTLLHLIGLGLSVVGTALVFLYAYPPTDEARRARYVRLTRVAVLLIFLGFLLQFIGALRDWLR